MERETHTHSRLVGGRADIPFPEGNFVTCIEALTMSTLSPESPASMNRSKGGNQTVENVNLSDIHPSFLNQSL